MAETQLVEVVAVLEAVGMADRHLTRGIRGMCGLLNNRARDIMSYTDYAKREFLAAGYLPIEQCKDWPSKRAQENVLELLGVLSSQGHSGSSIYHILGLFERLAKFEPLTPITGNNDEWIQHADGLFQNARYSKIFKAKNGAAYQIDAYIFWHWSECELLPDEDGYPGKRKFKSHFSSDHGARLVTFPFVPEKQKAVEVECFEINKETGEKQAGSGWWETIYPPHIICEKTQLDMALGRKPASNHVGPNNANRNPA